jgi:hypothetical protein
MSIVAHLHHLVHADLYGLGQQLSGTEGLPA